MAAKKKTVDSEEPSESDAPSADPALQEAHTRITSLQEGFDIVVAQRDTLHAGATEALDALNYAIGKGLIRAGSPMDKAFDKLRAAI